MACQDRLTLTERNQGSNLELDPKAHLRKPNKVFGSQREQRSIDRVWPLETEKTHEDGEDGC